LIETTDIDDEDSVIQAGSKKLAFEEMIQTVKPFCESIITTFKELSVKPTSASAEFGLKIFAEGNYLSQRHQEKQR
jgi:hypothetical protein